MAVNKLCFHVLLLIIYHNNAQYQPLPIRTATLTTSTTSENGANVAILDSNVVSTNSNNWLIKIPSWMNNNGDQTGFDMSINLDSNWGFHASKESTIEFTINSDQSTGGSDKDLILSFSVGDSKYFSIFLTLDNMYGNAIYPGCGSGLASGDIKAIVDNIYDNRDRETKAFGGQGLDNSRLQPSSNNYWPTTFTIRNNPSSNRVYIKLDNQYIQAQTCEYSTAFPANQGLQIYIASDEINDATIYLKQFQIDYSFQLTYPPSIKPTTSPTKNPTYAATLSPTKSPTKMPSNIPTNNPTKSPSTKPTDAPTITTITPSIQPSISPTNIPTKTPTKTPTNIPTITPTKYPSISPTKTPSYIPTYSPLKPTFSPTPRPVIIIGGNTASPTQENAGSIDESQVSTQEGDINNGKLNTENKNTYIIYYILAVVLFGLCLCCILAVICVHKNNRQQAQHKMKKIQKQIEHTTLGNSNDTYNKKYGSALRLNSLSPNSTNNQFVIATDISISNKNPNQNHIHFEHNLTSAVGVNNMLMDDIVNEMNDNNDVIDIIMTPKGSTKGSGQTPRLPPPPRRVQSNEDINNINIEMSSIMTPNGIHVDTGTDEDDTEGSDDMGTNESVMDKTFTNQNDEKDINDDYLDVMDNIVMTPENFGDHKRTMGGDSDMMDEYNMHDNPNVRYDEFVIGSEGGINNNHLTKQ